MKKACSKTMSSFLVVLAFCVVQTTYAADIRSSKATANIESVAFVQKLEKTLSSGSITDALSLFDSMPKSLQNSTDLQVLKASLLVSKGDIKEADALGTQLMTAYPNDVAVLEVNAMIAKAMKNTAKQSNVLKKILQLDPNNAEANIQLGQNAVLKHNYKAASRYYRTSLVNEPNNITGLAGLGQTAYYLDDLEESRIAFKKILALDEHNPVALIYLGKLEAEDSNYKAALNYVTEAIKYNSNSYDCYLDQGNYYRNLGKFKEAENAWTKAIEVDPNYFLAYAYRGGLYDEQNIFDKALVDYKMVVKTNPKYYFAYEALGILAWHEADYEEARKAFELARSIMPDNISYPMMIAATYLKQGNTVAAKKFLEGSLRNLDRKSVEYAVMRLYYEGGGRNAENDAILRVKNEDNSNKRGKMSYYMGLFYELQGSSVANEFYGAVLKLNSPMFFEYRLAEWSAEQ